MFKKLLLVFIVIPLIELYIILKVGNAVGFTNTLFSIILLGIIGAYLAKKQGLMVVNKVQQQLSQGLIPGNELLDGLIILAAALLLITPGLLTDLVGILLLVPFFRSKIRKYLKKLLRKWLESGHVMFNFTNFHR